VPCTVWLAVLLFDRASLRRFRPAWCDAPLLLWCAWPLLQSLLFVDAPQPAGAAASLYLLGSWGLTWLLGRVYCGGADGLRALAQALVLAGVACLPLAVVEGLAGARTYGWLFEPHPFRDDGAVRYLGWRPLGTFENGNQYGIWVSLCALVALWWAWSRARAGDRDLRWRWIAAVAAGVALAAQSVGALLLLLIGGGVLALSSRLRPRTMVAAALALGLASSALYLSGVVPIARIANETAAGRSVVAAVKSVGRGSFTWRIAQDQRALPTATQRPLVGSGQWNWWQALGSRPWGLAMLLLGQYGLIGMALAAAVPLLPAARTAWHTPRADTLAPAALPWVLALVVLLAMLDALLNSFVFFPALCVAGALCGSACGHGRNRVREDR
jgi:hypothetical protein